MFEYTGEDKGTILKIDNKSQFVDIREAFGIGKVKFQFRKYDKSKQAGQKTSLSFDIYMNIDEFGYLCSIIEDGSIARYARKNERKRIAENAEFAEPAFKDNSGTTAGGKCVARVLTIEKGEKADYAIKGVEGPGRTSDTGLIYLAGKTGNKWISIGLSKETLRKLAINGKRAIAIYDMWVANRCLDKRLLEIEPYRDQTHITQTVTINTDVYDKAMAVCEKRGKELSNLVEAAVKKFLADLDAKGQQGAQVHQQPASPAPQSQQAVANAAPQQAVARQTTIGFTAAHKEDDYMSDNSGCKPPTSDGIPYFAEGSQQKRFVDNGKRYREVNN